MKLVLLFLAIFTGAFAASTLGPTLQVRDVLWVKQGDQCAHVKTCRWACPPPKFHPKWAQ